MKTSSREAIGSATRTSNRSWQITMRRLGTGLLTSLVAALLTFLVVRLFHKSLHSAFLLVFVYFVVAAFFFYFSALGSFLCTPLRLPRNCRSPVKNSAKRKKEFYDTLPKVRTFIYSSDGGSPPSDLIIPPCDAITHACNATELTPSARTAYP